MHPPFFYIYQQANGRWNWWLRTATRNPVVRPNVRDGYVSREAAVGATERFRAAVARAGIAGDA